MLKRLKTYMVTGLLVLMPVVVTVYIMWFIFRFTDGLLGTILKRIYHRSFFGLGILVMFLLVLLTGLIAANYFGKRTIKWAEGFVSRIPLIGGLYGTTRQFAEALSSPEHGVFRRVVLVQTPSPGLYRLGFLTGEASDSIKRAIGQEYTNVFLPAVPNPTTGILIQVKTEELLFPEMDVDAGVKYIISAGVVKTGAERGRQDSG